MKVLIVDDREDNLYLLESLLGGNGFETERARDGNQALKKARESLPGLVISDILMPGMDGFALCREWKKDPHLKDVPFIFYTATYTDPRDEKLALDMGADRFILKPAEPGEFMQTIREVLSGYGSGREAHVKEPVEPETTVLKEYNEALIRKLEDKLEEIEKLNESLLGKEKKLLHINRVLRGIRAVNQLIVKERERETLVSEACRRIVGEGGYEGTWIVLIRHEKELAGFSQSGFSGPEFGELVELFRKGDLPPCCRHTLQSGEPVVLSGASGIHNDCPMKRFCGKTVSMTVPLSYEGNLYGFFVVSLPPEITADDEELSLLGEMAGDLAYSLTNLEMAEAIKRSEATLRATFESAMDGIILYDPENDKMVRCNGAIFRMLGYSSEEMGLLSIKDLHPPEGLPRVIDGLEKQMSGHSPLALDVPMRRKDGSVFYADVNTSPLVIDGRRHLLGIFRDVTERRNLETKERDALERVRRALGVTIHVLSQMQERRDPYTSGHQNRVADLAGAIALEMGFDQDHAEGIIMAGCVHDIGKISVPAEILSKPGRLSELEMQIIRDHPLHGRDILMDVDSPLPLAEIVFQHHERMNGSGYPRGLRGEDILVEARILAVADVVEAMASHRPYRPSHGIDVALEEIEKNKGILYDTNVVDVCLELFRSKGYVLPE
jgi:PAS domain S-box-containing protein